MEGDCKQEAAAIAEDVQAGMFFADNDIEIAYRIKDKIYDAGYDVDLCDFFDGGLPKPQRVEDFLSSNNVIFWLATKQSAVDAFMTFIQHCGLFKAIEDKRFRFVILQPEEYLKLKLPTILNAYTTLKEDSSFGERLKKTLQIVAKKISRKDKLLTEREVASTDTDKQLAVEGVEIGFEEGTGSCAQPSCTTVLETRPEDGVPNVYNITIQGSNNQIQTTTTQPSNALLDHSLMARLQLQEERQEGTSGDEAFSNIQGDEENIVASESKNVPISKEGGEINVGGCAVTFHLGSFDNVSKVYAKSEIDSSKWPPKYICITAMLWVQSERNLLKRASVAMKSWCMKNHTDSRKIEVHVLHQQNGSSTWDVVARLPLNDLKVFHFDCTDFSPYILGVHEDDFAATDHVIEGHVYAGRGNNFSLAFFLQHDLIKKSVIDDMAMKHSEFQLNFSPILVQPKDKIAARLKCMEETLRFPNEFEKSFEIDNKFVRLKKSFFHSSLIGTCNESKYVLLKCQVQQNDTLADGPHYFNYEWKPNQSGLERQTRPLRVMAEFSDAGQIRDLHLLGSHNTHDHRQYQGHSGPSPDSDTEACSSHKGGSS